MVEYRKKEKDHIRYLEKLSQIINTPYVSTYVSENKPSGKEESLIENSTKDI